MLSYQFIITTTTHTDNTNNSNKLKQSLLRATNKKTDHESAHQVFERRQRKLAFERNIEETIVTGLNRNGRYRKPSRQR